MYILHINIYFLHKYRPIYFLYILLTQSLIVSPHASSFSAVYTGLWERSQGFCLRMYVEIHATSFWMCSCQCLVTIFWIWICVHFILNVFLSQVLKCLSVWHGAWLLCVYTPVFLFATVMHDETILNAFLHLFTFFVRLKLSQPFPVFVTGSGWTRRSRN